MFVPRVAVCGLSKVYAGGQTACDAIDLDVTDGELLVLVGPSGSGKTTVLRLIAGLELPTSGSIQIGGRTVNGLAARHREVAMVFQNHAIYPHWTVYKNLAFGLELREGRGWRRWLTRHVLRKSVADNGSDLHARVAEAARILDIEPLLGRPASGLSGGEQQRVALGRAIVRRPALFLFDEPLSNLDAQLRVEMRRRLKQIHMRLGATMIYVTHDQTEALALGDRIAVLNRGRIEQVGPPQTIYHRPANRFVAGFIGTAPMNFFEGVWTDRSPPSQPCRSETWQLSAVGWEIETAAHWWQGTASREPALIGIRPEDVHLRRPADAPPEGGYPAVAAVVSLVEYQGDSWLVSLEPKNGAQTENRASPERPGAVLLGKALASSGLKPGEQVIAWLDMRRAHWFDGESGRNLRSPSLE
ncbi:MAG TPA: ABC transporter ATP-binding protein [Pirellulales bacterium]|nr:ABC transporter ATP-binding protein [Pirellulales bacterium]